MNQTPRGLRPHIVIAGNCNSGKSSLLNAIIGADTSMVSPVAGTTTDPVFKNFELLPFGPVTFVDTAGLDDTSQLGDLRGKKSRSALASADLVLLVIRPASLAAGGEISASHQRAVAELRREIGSENARVLTVFTHADNADDRAIAKDEASAAGAILVSNATGEGIAQLKEAVISVLEVQKKEERSLLENFVRAYRLVMLVVPIDLEAPAGRLILPQVQSIREILDSDAGALVVKEREIEWALGLLKSPPDLAITDSQVVLKAGAAIPDSIPLTTFSILFSRQKGDLATFVNAARRIDELRDGDRVIIAETCAHKQMCDDIGRVKIPRWLRNYTGRDLRIDTISGPLPDDLSDAKLVVHCGGCMITRRMMLSRMGLAASSAVPITNYGIAISHVQGMLERVIRPFREELSSAFQ